MFDPNAIGGAITGLKAATELVQLAVKARDAAVIRAKAIELQSQIVAAYESAIAALTNEHEMLERVRYLEEKVANLEAWETEKQRYELVNIRDPGTTQHFGAAWVRSLKADAGPTEPPHLICPNCYEKSEKSILQEEQREMRIRILFCQQCRLEISRTGPSHDVSSHWATSKPRK